MAETSDVKRRPIYWFSMLDLALESGNQAAVREAIAELDQMGIAVTIRERANRPAARKRSAFTLIELLCVIAIIALLIGIMLPALQAVRARAKQAESVTEIAQLSLACSNAVSTQGATYFPTAVWLQSNYNLANAQDQASVQALRQFFGVRFAAGSQPLGIPPGTSGLPPAMWNTPQYLNGNQSLVFFLGGYCLDPNNPAAPGFGKGFEPGVFPFVKTSQPTNIWFDFKVSRLWFPPGSNVPMYLDVYSPRNGSNLPGTPYFAFSDYQGQGYDQAPLNPGGTMTVPAGVYTQYVTGATAGLPGAFTMTPFKDVAGNWINRGTVQIVSAGADSLPGPGYSFPATGLWAPGQGAYGIGQPGFDDVANFASATLGVKP